MHATGIGAAVLAVISGLIVADILFHWQGANALLGTGSKFASNESRLLAGRG